MSLIRHGYAVRSRRGFLDALCSALLALALLYPGATTAQEVKQIKLTDKHIQGLMAAYEDIAAAVRDRQRRDNTQTAELISRGTPTVPVTTGIDGGMNPIFLAAVKSRGGPGATIRTASGTIPAYVNPPAEPAQTATGGLASAE